MRTAILLLPLVLGCDAINDAISSEPERTVSAKEVCAQLVAREVGTNCRRESTGALGSSAQERWVLDLAHGKEGQVLIFQTEGEYDAAWKAFEAASVLAGKHRYGSRSSRIIVQLNSETPDDIGRRAKSYVDSIQ